MSATGVTDWPASPDAMAGFDPTFSARATRSARLWSWAVARRRGLAVTTGLLVTTGVLQAVNMASAPGPADGEGAYVADAWAIGHLDAAGAYRFSYVRPPLGWLQLAAWTLVSKAFDRTTDAVLAGREAMLVAQLISTVLIWVLARRLGLTRWAGAFAVILFGLSPLALQLHRMVFLETIALPWLLGAFVLACTPRRHLALAAAGAACFAVAVLTKESTLLLLPAYAWFFWQSAARPTRRYAVAVAGSLLALILGLYLLHATLQGQLLPGPDHASLLDGLRFQLFERNTTGNLLEAASFAYRVDSVWVELLTAGPLLVLIAAPVALIAIPRLAPVALASLVLVPAILRPGYLLAPVAVLAMPFGALVIAGATDWLWHWHEPVYDRQTAHVRRSGPPILRRPTVLALLVAAVLLLDLAAPAWAAHYRDLLFADREAPERQAEDWIVDHVPGDRHLIVSDALWVDLVRRKFPANNVVWYDRLELDPAVGAVSQSRVSEKWRGYDVVVATAFTRTHADAVPQTQAAVAASQVVAQFGEGAARIEVRRIVPPTP
jgi:hypothetical protein